MREKLIEILTSFYGVDPMYFGVEAQALADHLIANGVVISNLETTTNADRIRAMNDEKLADAWIRCNTICHLCAYRDECEFDEYVIYEKCKEGIMEWLKQPADMRGEEE